MPSRVRHAGDLDNEALAADLRRLADAIEDHDAHLLRATTAHTAAVEDGQLGPSVATLMLRYHFTDETLADQLTYITDTEDSNDA